MTLPQLAARLAGGFIRPTEAQDLDLAIRNALEIGGFADLESVKDLPGMKRSVAWSLDRIWNADVSLADPSLLARAGASTRLGDIAAIETRVRAALPTGVLIPPDLRDAALMRIRHAPAVLGAVVFDAVPDVAPIWQPLIVELAQTIKPWSYFSKKPRSLLPRQPLLPG